MIDYSPFERGTEPEAPRSVHDVLWPKHNDALRYLPGTREFNRAMDGLTAARWKMLEAYAHLLDDYIEQRPLEVMGELSGWASRLSKREPYRPPPHIQREMSEAHQAMAALYRHESVGLPHPFVDGKVRECAESVCQYLATRTEKSYKSALLNLLDRLSDPMSGITP